MKTKLKRYQILYREKYDAYDGIAKEFRVGMDEAGKLYEEEEYYIPELLMFRCYVCWYGCSKTSFKT